MFERGKGTQWSGQSFVVLRKDVKADTVTIEALNRPSGPGSARRACVGEVREVSGRQWAASILEK